jgi:hypothetical protein
VAGPVINSPTPPLSPAEGNLWFNTTTGREFVWYVNPTTFVGQWVQTQPTGGGVPTPIPGPTTLPTPPSTGPHDVTRVPNITVSQVPPLHPVPGDLWWNTIYGNEFIWYDDGNTQQWVVSHRGNGGSDSGFSFDDAPINGKQYGRQNQTWTESLPIVGGELIGPLLQSHAAPAYIMHRTDMGVDQKYFDFVIAFDGNAYVRSLTDDYLHVQAAYRFDRAGTFSSNQLAAGLLTLQQATPQITFIDVPSGLKKYLRSHDGLLEVLPDNYGPAIWTVDNNGSTFQSGLAYASTPDPTAVANELVTAAWVIANGGGGGGGGGPFLPLTGGDLSGPLSAPSFDIYALAADAPYFALSVLDAAADQKYWQMVPEAGNIVFQFFNDALAEMSRVVFARDGGIRANGVITSFNGLKTERYGWPTLVLKDTSSAAGLQTWQFINTSTGHDLELWPMANDADGGPTGGFFRFSRDGAMVVSGNLTSNAAILSGYIAATGAVNPAFAWNNTGNVANKKRWDLFEYSDGDLYLRTLNDDSSPQPFSYQFRRSDGSFFTGGILGGASLSLFAPTPTIVMYSNSGAGLYKYIRNNNGTFEIWDTSLALLLFSVADNALVTISGRLALSSNGTAAAPAIARGTSGIFFSGANGTMYFATNGVSRGNFDTGGNLWIDNGAVVANYFNATTGGFNFVSKGSVTAFADGKYLWSNNSGSGAAILDFATATNTLRVRNFADTGDGAFTAGTGTFSGVVTTPTPASTSNDTTVPTTAFVQAAIATILQNAQTGSYNIVAADAGRHIYHAVAAAAATYTIPANATVAFVIGTTVTLVNESVNNVTIAIGGSDTLVWSPAGTTGPRTLAAFGIATALKVTATRWLLSGTGLT